MADLSVVSYVGAPAARGTIGAKINRSLLIQIAITVVTVVVVFAPILPLFYQSIIDRPLYEAGAVVTASNYTNLLSSPTILEVLWNTTLVVVLTTAIAQVIGTALAILIGRTDLPGRSFLGDLVLLPMYLSSLVLAFGWFIAYGPSGYITAWFANSFGGAPWNLYSIAGMALIGGISQAPLAFLYCQASTALSDPSLEQAARSCGAGPMRTLWSVTMPMLLPAIVSSGILNATSALESLAIPLIFGQPAGITVFTTFLYEQGIVSPRPDYGLVATAAAFMLLLVVGLVFLQNRILRNASRYISVTGKVNKPKMFELGPYRWLVFAIVATYALLFCVAPMVFLAVRGLVPVLSPLIPFWKFLTLQYLVEVFTVENYQRSIINTLLISLIGGVFGTLYIALVALVSERSSPGFGPLKYIALFPRAVPGLIAGLGFFYAMTFLPGMSLLQNSVWLLAIAYVMRYIPTGYGAISPSLMQIGPGIDRAAKVSGADWWTTTHSILLPIMRPALFACFSLLFIQFLKEYTVALFLFSPDTEVMGVTLLRRWAQGEVARVAALSTVQMFITISVIYLMRRFFGVKFYG
ncbi:iron ABC transporter permease [Ensifer adhaerens]|uniref:ABC transporter permease n=1 Tax=Ensifer adhaerens TaxID=106592 RepID=UPI0023A97FD6|nr:iron ABC transporter permease [Ensifer adhaerens]WDZ76227.1 iron ABC transporter permease [Ensifer adhaerens]